MPKYERLSNSLIDVAIGEMDLIVPYMYPVGYGPGGLHVSLATREDWEAYEWNPPPGMAKPDPSASPKPSWEDLLAGAQAAEMRRARIEALAALRNRAQDAITMAYGCATRHEEIFLRLRDGHTAAQDKERDRLLEAYKARKAKIKAMRTEEELREERRLLVEEPWP